MECKKIIGCTLIIGSIWALYEISQNNFMVSCIKRKGKQLTKKMEDFFNNLDENGLKKYKEKLVDDFNNLKQKIAQPHMRLGIFLSRKPATIAGN